MKCLVMMHLPLSNSTNSGKTMASMLKCWDKDDICQIYIKNTEVENDLCSDFFLIDEKLMLRKMLKPSYEVGTEIKKNPPITNLRKCNILKKDRIVSSNIRFLMSRLYPVLLMRNVAWKNKHWNSLNLNKWLNEMKPEIILLVPGYIIGFIECAEYIADRYSIPIATFVTDDYFTRSFSLNPIKSLLNRNLNMAYKSLLGYSDLHYVIGKHMADIYSRDFGCNHIPIMNSVDTCLEYVQKKTLGGKIKFAYFGGIELGRLSSIYKLAKVIGELNKNDNRIIFELYCNGISYREKAKFESNLGCKYKGYLSGETLIETMQSMDILVHIESFSRRYKKILSTAISTKIPEYLNIGRLLFVFGPSYAESIRIVADNKLGEVVINNDKTALETKILQLLDNKESYESYINNGKEYAKKFFSVEKNSKQIYQQLCNARKTKVK